MTSLRNLGVVCSVDDAPAVSLHGASEGDVLADLRVKSLDSGKLYRRAFTVPEVRDGKVYAMLPGYGFGERVAIGFDALPFEAVRLWYESDTEEPFREWIEAAVSAPAPEGPQETPAESPTTDEEPSEASEVPEDEEPERSEKLRCTTDDIFRILRQHPDGMTVRAIAEILGVDALVPIVRTNINKKLRKLEKSGWARIAGTTRADTGQPAFVCEAIE